MRYTSESKLKQKEAASAGGRGAGGLEFGGRSSRGAGLGTGYLGMNGLQKGGSHSRLGMRPLGRGDSAAAIVVAATGASDDELSGFPDQLRSLRSVARMNRPADAARMRRRSGSRHSQRAKVAHKRDQQQKSGDRCMAGLRCSKLINFQTPKATNLPPSRRLLWLLASCFHRSTI